MKCTAKEVLQYAEENDVKFVKLTFCDLFGRQKNISIVSQQLPTIFESGYLFNSSAVAGFKNCKGDLLLFPDPKTLSVLPWRPQTGEVVSLLSNIKRPDGSFYEYDTMHLLDAANARLGKLGIRCRIATDCEFYVFKTDPDGNPTVVPIDRAGYGDSAPEDEGENIRRDIILSLEDMGIEPTASHHERGPGQNEIDFKPTEPNTAARNLLYFKAAVKNMCRLNGVYATFAPKPLADAEGSALRVVLTLECKSTDTAPLDAFAAGILEKASELLPFFNTTADSFSLLDELRAPACDYEHANRISPVRVLPQAEGKTRIEINAADCLCNPFLAFALLLEAGLYGVEHACTATQLPALPVTLADALRAAEQSEWLRSVLTPDLLNEYIAAKRVSV